MASNLIIAETSQKARTIGAIARQLDPENSWRVFSTGYRIAFLDPNKLSIERGTFSLNWKFEGKRYFNKFFQDVIPATMVWIATNPDSAGELLASQIKHQIEDRVPDKPIRRIWPSELTPGAIGPWIRRPDEVDETTAAAEEARLVIERWMRFALGDFLQEATGTPITLGASAAMLLWTIGTTRQWSVDTTLPNGPVVRQSGLTHEQAEKFVDDLDDIDITSRPGTLAPPEPFNTWTFLEAGYKTLGLTAPELMASADQLYEQGIITYPRTPASWIPDPFVKEIRNYILPMLGEKMVEQRFPVAALGPYYTEAIRPTVITVDPSKVHPSIRNVYRLIWAQTLASQSVEAVGVDVNVRLLGTDHEVADSYFDVNEPGFRRLGMGLLGSLEPSGDPDNGKMDPNIVPSTDDAWVAGCMSMGLGDPGQAISVIGYMLKEKLLTRAHGGLVVTPRGLAVAALLRDRMPEFKPDVLRQLRRDLDNLVRGNADRAVVLSSYDKFTQTVIGKADTAPLASTSLCPECNKALQVVFYGGDPVLRCPSVAADAPFGDGCSLRVELAFDDKNYPLAAVKQPQDANDAVRDDPYPPDVRPPGG